VDKISNIYSTFAQYVTCQTLLKLVNSHGVIQKIYKKISYYKQIMRQHSCRKKIVGQCGGYVNSIKISLI